nr:MAG TPA_asm: hypothetical protein [Bacteriophage sp.]
MSYPYTVKFSFGASTTSDKNLLRFLFIFIRNKKLFLSLNRNQFGYLNIKFSLT